MLSSWGRACASAALYKTHRYTQVHYTYTVSLHRPFYLEPSPAPLVIGRDERVGIEKKEVDVPDWQGDIILSIILYYPVESYRLNSHTDRIIQDNGQDDVTLPVLRHRAVQRLRPHAAL